MSQAFSSPQVGGWSMEGEGRGGERGIGCQKAPIANEMEEEDGEGDGEERTGQQRGIRDAACACAPGAG